VSVTALNGFDQATRVRALGDGRFAADLHPDWTVNGRANGGYLLALATRAALKLCPPEHPHPLAVTGAFAACRGGRAGHPHPRAQPGRWSGGGVGRPLGLPAPPGRLLPPAVRHPLIMQFLRDHAIRA
jgi:hypothetical protein